MSFHLGKPILAMLVIAALTGAVVLLRPAAAPADLNLWVFADAHAATYRALRGEFERSSGRTLHVDQVTNLALNMRLTSLLMSGDSGEVPPDAVEVEIASIGRYFRGPAGEVGFLPLNDRLENSGFREIATPSDPGRKGWNARLRTDGQIYTHDGTAWVLNPSRTRPDAWIDRIVRGRFAPWSKGAVIFGVPHDVHPVSLTYRHDLFTEAGVDLPSARTWREFHEKCVAFQNYWRSRGYANRHAMELPLSAADDVVVMLLQRHINVVDNHDRIHVADPRAAETIAFYARLVAGPLKIGAESSGGPGVWAGDVVSGNTCAFITPDWKTNDLRSYAPSMAGKMRMMPLPVFDEGDARTSTWGGTMIGIPRRCRDPDAAWRLIEFLYFSDRGLAMRRAESNILPPLIEEYDKPGYHRPDPYFGGQKVDELYAQLAGEIPERHVSPLTVAAQVAVGLVLGRAVDRVRAGGSVGLEAACEAWLREADQELRRRLEHGRWEPEPAGRAAASLP